MLSSKLMKNLSKHKQSHGISSRMIMQSNKNLIMLYTKRDSSAQNLPALDLGSLLE